MILIISGSSGCSGSRRLVKDGQSRVLDAYLKGVSDARADTADYIRENLRVSKAFGYVKPYAPIVEPAEVRLVWLPAHKSKHSPEVLVSGHWVYIMVKPARWFIDAQKQDKARIPLIVPYKQE